MSKFARKKVRVTFEFVAPKYNTMAETINFIIRAVQNWGGQLHPDDEMFSHFHHNFKKVGSVVEVTKEVHK